MAHELRLMAEEKNASAGAVTWEHSEKRNGNYEAFDAAESETLEDWARSTLTVGDRSSEVYLEETKVVYCNGIQFQADTLIGLKMEIDGGDAPEHYVRRQGPAFPLKKKRGAKNKKDGGGPEAEMKKAEAMRKQQEKIEH